MTDDQRVRVLVLESDSGRAHQYARLVESLGSHSLIGVVATVPRAWEALKTCPVDLMVIGEPRPSEDAALLLRQLRYANAPLDVIHISANADANTVRQSQRLGVSDYLVSPVRPERFLQSLQQIGRFSRLTSAPLAQAEIDQLRAWSNPARQWVPRELSAERLSTVRQHLRETAEPVSAASVALALSMSRVTARRYLEFMVSTGELGFESVAERPGRPIKIYEPRLLVTF